MWQGAQMHPCPPGVFRLWEGAEPDGARGGRRNLDDRMARMRGRGDDASPAERLRARARIAAPFVAILLLVAMAGAMAVTPTRDLLRQKQRITALADDLHRTRSQNRALQRRIDRLRNPDYIEQQARAQLGLVRPGEIQYVVMPPPHRPGHHRNERRRHEHATRLAAPPGFLQRLIDFIAG